MYDNNNQILYEGEYKNNQINGYGIIYFTKGKCEGEFKDGKLEGYALSYINNKIAYIGGYKNGLKDGFGIFYYDNHIRYEGELYQDKRDLV